MPMADEEKLDEVRSAGLRPRKSSPSALNPRADAGFRYIKQCISTVT
jgi:hypothetical protein